MNYFLRDVEIEECKQSVLQEVFGVYPVGLTKVGQVSGRDIYTSDKLRIKFLDAIAKQKITRPVYKEMAKLTNVQKILPVYTVKSLISYIIYKIKARPFEKGLAAFFSPETNKNYVLFDNRVKFFIWTKNKDLSIAIIHELQHYAAWNLKARFLSMNKNPLLKWYSDFFSTLFDSDIKPRDCEPILKWAFFKVELAKDFPNKMYEQYKQMMMKTIAGRIKEDAEIKIDQYIAVSKMYFYEPDKFINELMRRHKVVFPWFQAHLIAYKKSGFRKINSLCGQETLFPSEVISIESEWPQSNHYAVIRALT